MNIIQLPLVALLISILIIILFFSKKHVKNSETEIYKNMLKINFLFSFLSVVIVLYALLGIDDIYIGILQKVYLSLMIILIFLILIYNFSISGLTAPKTNNILFILNLMLIFPIIITDLTVVNTGEVLDGYGTSYDIAIILTVIYFLLITLTTIYILIRNKKNIKKDIPFIILIILFSLGLLIRKYYPSLIFETFFFSFMMLIMYHTIENPDVKMINELELAKNTAEKANRAKTDFLSSMSHEIRTPLNAIVGLSEVIKNNDDIEEIHEDANDVVMASKNLLEIVNGILDISKIEANKMEIIETNYNPVEVFNELTTIALTRISEKEIELKTNFASDIPNTLYGDRVKLKQIITNLLTNAVKYTEKGYIDFNVSCINSKDTCKLQIIISDTGRGIKEDQMDKIFNKFERSEEDRNTTIEGTGLGLAITKSLVEMMGGKILVHSTYGEGSKFTVFLEQKISNETIELSEVKEEIITYKDKKVLIVDDNKLNIKVATKILNEFELNIDSSDSGFGAIEKIENNEHYDIIFMDIMMPKMSGVETLKKLKKIDNFNIPVVALTADAIQGKSNKYIEVGFDEYLTKPIDKKELKKVLNKCLNGINEKAEEKQIEDPNIHKIIPVTDEDVEILNKKLAEMLEQENNN